MSKQRRLRRRRQRKVRTAALATFPLSFGRYRNVPLRRIPADYLRWLLSAENIPPADKWAVEQFLKRPRPGGRRQ